MLDVGQGDSIFISLPNNKGNILIDTGGYNYETTYSLATKKIIPYLKSIGIKKLDYLIESHGDKDHMGESINLIKNFKVDKVIFNNGEYNDLEQELIEVLEEKDIKYYKGLKELNISNNKFEFLNTGLYDNENDNSNVIYFSYNDYKFLFMGDSSVIREQDILDKYNLSNIDFLKVGHHGSNTSSGKEFINSIKPKYSIISVGVNNRYGHPKDSVLETLANSKIYRTDYDGSIEIKINKSGYKIRTYS
jgi:competence protein ComEC